MIDLFVSHVEEDTSVAVDLAMDLERGGYQVWMYRRDSLPGKDYIQQIVEAIDHTKAMVLVISTQALASSQVDREVRRAFLKSKPILPVLVEMSVQEFQQRKPDWDHMLGTAGIVVAPQSGVHQIRPQIVAGLSALGVPPEHAAGAGRLSSNDSRDNLDSANCFRISTLAHDLNISSTDLMRYVREVLHIEVRTPSGMLTESQAHLLREHLSKTENASKAGTLNTRLPFRLDLGADLSMEFVFIVAEPFRMGSPPEEEGHNDDEVEHLVKLSKAFWISSTPVTQAQFERVMGFNPSYFAGPTLPVEMVSWFDAVAFCEALFQRFGKPFRLPTEAEWECACRAGTTTPFSFGHILSTDQANYDGKFTYGGMPQGVTRWTTTPVGSFQPNPWQLYDMHGNVWEWCSDWYGTYEPGRVTDPKGQAEGEIRVLRGGSWFNGPADCRSAQRDALDPGRRHSLYGFRVAMSAD